MTSNESRFASTFIALAAVILVTVAGCGGSGSGPSKRGISATTAKDDGFAALEKKDWKTADQLLTQAINSKILNADLHEEAMLGRARARIELGEYDAVAEDLTPLEAQAAAMDQVWLLKSNLAIRKNDMSSAQTAYAEAKKINPKLPKPEGLK